MDKYPGTKPAPKGQIWVCAACGKRSKTRYGIDENNKDVADRGWDAACMLNAVLCYDSLILPYKAVETDSSPIDEE